MNIKPARLYPILLAVAGSLIIAACGSSSSTGSTHTSTTASTSRSRTKLAACLKQHGVTLPSRPGAGHGGFFGGGAPPPGAAGAGSSTTPSGTRPPGAGGFSHNPKLQAAFKACGGTRGSFGAGRFRRPHFSAATLTAFATCVRKHGYNLPKPNTSGSAAIFPRSIQSNPKFIKASRSCASILRPTSTTTSTSSS